MSRYTNADILINGFISKLDDEETLFNQVARCFIKLLRSSPSIDIVFCKDCKHRPIKEDADGADYGFNIIAPEGSSRCPCLVDDGWYSWMPKDNFFCGYGEREDE